MNKLIYISLVLSIGSLSLSSCLGQVPKTNTRTFDPLEFGKKYTSVCKIGLKGGDGTLIENSWVLTAGHVAEGMYRRTNGDLSVYFENGAEYKVKHVYLHPKFKPMGLFDLALLELENEVKDIPPTKINVETDELNQQIILAGHGDKKQADGSWIKDGKLRAYTNIIDEVNETHIIFDYDSPENNPTEREGTSGPGDSGGPAFIITDNSLYVAGVSSMGEPGINGPTTYGAIEHFVRVSKFQDWIKQTINAPNTDNALSANKSTSNDRSGSIEISNSERATMALLIIDALENYSEEKMISAISETYDPAILQKRSAKEIIKNMPALIRELQNAKLEKVMSESVTKISFQLKKGNNTYGLDIFFRESSQKIEQMAFGRFN